MSAGNSRPTVKVWDLLVRIGHWTIVAGVITAWFTRGKWHEWIGYTVLAVITVRIIWGWAGSRYARFTQFVRTPADTLRYGKQILAHQEPRHLGHNPLGGWMIVALLITLFGICSTGWLYTTEQFWGVEWVEELHEKLTYTLFSLVALHVGGVIFSSLRHRENLLAAMLHGRKRGAAPKDVA